MRRRISDRDGLRMSRIVLILPERTIGRLSADQRGWSARHMCRSVSTRGASAGRAEKCTSGDDLTMAAPAGVFRQPVPNRLGNQLLRVTVAKRCLRGSERLRCIFRTDGARWPHRAAGRHASARPR
jgi:hypothetical protein